MHGPAGSGVRGALDGPGLTGARAGRPPGSEGEGRAHGPESASPGARRTVSLVLGSGGARGLAHIGVIEALLERGYDIRSISGASMGAVVGGVYAAGQLDRYTDWVRALRRVDVLRLLDLSFHSAGLFKGERIIGTLRELVGDWRIEDLPVSYTAVATDLESGKEVWLDRGPLFEAIRASIAIPTIFTPHRVEGRQLVDGGLANPVPIAPTLADRTDLTIAVNPSSRSRSARTARKPSRPAPEAPAGYGARVARFVDELVGERASAETDLGLFDVITRSMDVLQNLVARLQLAAYSPDILIEISRDACLVYEFHRADELIELGREATARALEAESS